MNNAIIHKSTGSGLLAVDPNQASAIAEKVLAENGNLVKLTAVERKIYYLAMCDHYGLDPWSNPFDYLEQKNKGAIERVSLYPNIRAANAKIATNNLSVEIRSQKVEITGKENSKYGDGSYEVGWAMVEVRVGDGRRSLDEVGYVEIGYRLKRGDAIKKAITQARRRAVMAFCGLADAGESAISAEYYDPPMDAIALPTTPIKRIEASVSNVPEVLPPAEDDEPSNRDRIQGIIDLTQHNPAQAKEIRLGLFGAKKAIADYSDSEMLKLREALYLDWAAKYDVWSHDEHRKNAYGKIVGQFQHSPSDEELFAFWQADCDRRLSEKSLEAEAVPA